MSKWTTLILLILLIFLLGWRWQIATVRFFDVDEFSYMHWAAQVAGGQRQYVDFLSYFTPGFFWTLAPIFWIVGKSAQVFVVGRIVSFGIFLLIVGAVSTLWGITRGWKWALLPAVLLTFLPMPYDKFLEIRPDNLATFLGVLGVIGEIRALQSKKAVWWLVSGLAYSASLFVLPKTLPIVGVGAGIAVIYWLVDKKMFAPSKILLTSPVLFLLGLFGPWAVFFGGALLSGHFSTIWYSLARLPFEAYKSSLNIPMEAHLFFFPNASFYGIGQGITAGLIANHAIWILAIIVGTLRFITPLREGDRTKAMIELLIGGIFFISIFGYVKYFPAKHSQYLIPIAVFVAYYAADGLSGAFDWLKRTGGFASLGIALLGLIYLLVMVTPEVNAPKMRNTNAAQIRETTALLQMIPPEARVVDLEGRMLFWPEGYPVCCMTVDRGLAFVSRHPVPLAQYLTTRPAQYIWDGSGDRLITFNEDSQVFIQKNFTPVPGWEGRLYKLK